MTYVICTNVVYIHGRTVSKRNNFIISTEDILSGRWSDPIYFEFDGIDPSLFFDDDGKVYIQACKHPKGGIWQLEFDLTVGQAVTAPTLLWDGWDGRFTEGPHIYKKQGYYYLLVAEGGTFEDHMISVARSKSVHGPFEPCPGNPLLITESSGSIGHTGHGDFFQDTQGDWWTVFLGVRKVGKHAPIGRESFVARVEWPAGQWPSIGSPILESTCDNSSYVHLRDAVPDSYRISDHELEIRPTPAGLSAHKTSPSFVGRCQTQLHGHSSATLLTDHASHSVKAGICIYKDEHRFASVGFDSSQSVVYFEACNRATEFSTAATSPVTTEGCVHLAITYTPAEWTFLYRAPASDEWCKLGLVETAQLSGRDFTGPLIGAFAVGPEEEGFVKFTNVHL